MKNLVGFAILIVLAILQTVIISRIPLLNGTADIVFLVLVAWALQEKVQNAWPWTLFGGLVITFLSAMPLFALFIGYIISTLLARWFRRRVWQAPILAMYLATLAGTFIIQFTSIIALQMNESAIDIIQSLNSVVLPSVLLNMLFALPVHAMVADLAEWIYPATLEI